MIDRPITLGGPPGGGKSTAGRALALRLGLTYVSAGEFFRADGRARGMTVEEYSRFAEAHPEVDEALDRRVQEFARPGCLLDGRIQGPLARRRGVAVYGFIVTARAEVRAVRVARRDGLSVTEAARRIEAREASEVARYRQLYGIDLAAERDETTIDSSDLTPAEVVEQLAGWLPGGSR
ncbi:MAG: (d)CMP kinase [Thermoplasmata archaeon]